MPDLIQRFVCSQRQALRIVRMSASTYLYVSQGKDENVLKVRFKEITDRCKSRWVNT